MRRKTLNHYLPLFRVSGWLSATPNPPIESPKGASMKRTVVLFSALLAVSGAHANCVSDGGRTQSVALFVDGRQVDRWDIEARDVHRVRLPQGFELGLRIEPATAEKYR